MDIILCGVGGQGTVMASRVIGEAAIASGYKVKTSEIIGMAQREGSVVSQVRFDQEISSPLIPDQGADILMGFELAEAVRNIHRLKPNGCMLVNMQKIVPPSVYLGMGSYNEDALLGFLKEKVAGLICIDAIQLAREAGNPKTVSAVFLGAFCGIHAEFDRALLLSGLLKKLPEKVRDVNTRAFELGERYISKL